MDPETAVLMLIAKRDYIKLKAEQIAEELDDVKKQIAAACAHSRVHEHSYYDGHRSQYVYECLVCGEHIRPMTAAQITERSYV